MELKKLIDQNVECVGTPNGSYLNKKQVMECIELHSKASAQQRYEKISAELEKDAIAAFNAGCPELSQSIKNSARQLRHTA